MREIGEIDVGTALPDLLDAVEKGEEVTITRDGKPVAKLVAPDVALDRAKAFAAVERIRSLRKGVTLGPDLTLKDLIDEGRR